LRGKRSCCVVVLGVNCTLEKRLADRYHIIVDPACKDVSRLRFVSFDPDAFITDKPVPVFKTYLPKAKAAPKAEEPAAEEEENAPPTKRKSKSEEPATAGKPNLAKLAAQWDDE